MPDPKPLTVACTLEPAEGQGRRQRWLELASRALESKERTRSGVRLRYSASAETEQELRELAALERECCSFATWSLASLDDRIELEVSGDGDGVEAIWRMFDEAPLPP